MGHRIELTAIQGPYENPDLIRFTGQAKSGGGAFPVEFHMSLECFEALEQPKHVVLRVRESGSVDGSGEGPNTGPRG